MFALIHRELQDHLAYLLVASLISIVMIAIMVCTVLWSAEESTLTFTILLTVVLLPAFYALGVAQMYVDRANRVSPLLATRAVTRSRILAARVLAGGIVILLTLAPPVIAATVLLHRFAPPLAFYWRMIVQVSMVVVLTGFACYCMGLLVGWSTSLVKLVGGALLLLPLVVPIALIKGAGTEAIALLLLLVVASLLRVWHEFTSVSL
jgi:ABC-type transport system involved in multi-copper enzyme maturation permease subunit